MSKYKIMIMGASYGSLLGAKLCLAGHDVDLICLPAEAKLINEKGILVRIPVRSRNLTVELASRELPGTLSAAIPADTNPDEYDLVAMAMQEPQYRAAEIRQLLNKVTSAAIPCMSIMNMPPLPFLARLPRLDTDQLRQCYTDASVWDNFDPNLMTLASPDPQAFRPPEEESNVLQITLPTNFKVARFESDQHTAMLRSLQSDIEAARIDIGGEEIELPVKLKVHDSIFVPLAKWSMLLTGNYRCILTDSVRSIQESVHSDIEASRSVYEWVGELCCAMGASPGDLVPFEKYASAAKGLSKPSSAARALDIGMTHIERVDCLVSTLAENYDMNNEIVSRITETVDKRLLENRRKSERGAN